MQFKREIYRKIQELSLRFPCLVLTGARQVGKTTLLRQLFPTHTYVSLDLPSLAERAELQPEEFFKEYPAPLLIDEIQYAPALFRHLKASIDRHRHEHGRFILTGSQKFVLMKEVSESLAGRAAILELETLSLQEIGDSLGSYTHAMGRGLFPELWRQPSLVAADYYSSYLATYLERDVRQILNISSLRDFERFLRSCAARSAQLLNMSDLGRDVGIKGETARQWISVLETSGQVSLLEPYYENIGKRIVKSPKLYLNDPGLLCFLLGFSENSLGQTPFVGAVWETLVYAELRKRKVAQASPSQLYFYRDGQGREVDFLKVHEGRIDLIEAKWTESPDRRWFDAIDDVAKSFSRSRTHQIGAKVVICATDTPRETLAGKIENPRSWTP